MSVKLTVYPWYRDEVTGREWGGEPREIELEEQHEHMSVTDGPLRVVHSMSGELGPMAESDGPDCVRRAWAPFAWIGLACQLAVRAWDAFLGLRERRPDVADLERRMVEAERQMREEMREEAEGLWLRQRLTEAPPRPESAMSYAVTTASTHRMPVMFLPHAEREPGDVRWAEDVLRWQTSTHARPAPLVLSDEAAIPCAPPDPQPLRTRRHIRTGEPE